MRSVVASNAIHLLMEPVWSWGDVRSEIKRVGQDAANTGDDYWAKVSPARATGERDHTISSMTGCCRVTKQCLAPLKHLYTYTLVSEYTVFIQELKEIVS